MSEPCYFCHGPVNPHDLNAYKQVVGWVHGKKRDSMTLREDTGKYAHEGCVNKAKAGQPVDQPDLFGEDAVVTAKESGEDFIEFIEGLNEEVEAATGIKMPTARGDIKYEREDENF